MDTETSIKVADALREQADEIMGRLGNCDLDVGASYVEAAYRVMLTAVPDLTEARFRDLTGLGVACRGWHPRCVQSRCLSQLRSFLRKLRLSGHLAHDAQSTHSWALWP